MNKNFTELFKEIDDNLKKIDFYFENLKEDSLKFLSIYSISSYFICLSYLILFYSVSPFYFLNNSSEPGNTSEVIRILN